MDAVERVEPWFEKAIRDHCDEHGPSGGAWNISMILERLHRAARSNSWQPIESAEKPRRAHVLKIEFGANTLDDLCYALEQTALDLRMGAIATKGCSGSPSVGFIYEYDVDESWTKDRYFAALDRLPPPPHTGGR